MLANWLKWTFPRGADLRSSPLTLHDKVVNRHHKTCLHTMPEFRSIGSYADEAPVLRWVQPSDAWQAQLLIHHGSFTYNGMSMPVEPFDLLVIPPGGRCEVERFGQQDYYVYDYFAFTPIIGERDVVSLPLKTSLGESGHFWDLEFRKALTRLQFSKTSSHVLCWHLLLSVAQPEHIAIKSVYTEQAEALISERLAQKLAVSQICRELNISQSQLTRLFVSELGRSPLQYIRDRRAQLALKLLTNTTLPIKQVGATCGIPNAHQFNRFVRERFGESPRSLRNHRGIVDIYHVSDLKKGRGRD